MPNDFEEFHAELRAVAGQVLTKDGSWDVLVDTGWTGLEIAEAFGGAGAGFTEVALICQEIGRAGAATGYLGGAVLAVGALNALAPSGVRDNLLCDIAAGSDRTAVVLEGFQLRNKRLYGSSEFVLDADGCDRLLVLADVEGESPALAVANGLMVTPQPVLDDTRSVARVSADGLAVAEVLEFEDSRPRQVLLDRAAVAIACDSLGLAQAMLDETVSYVRMRHQFGRPIGSFQAVKHACADMLVTLTVSRQLVDAAVGAVAAGVDTTAAASMAKAHATSAAVDITGKAMQLHGGIGYTWESGIHVYLKRAALNRSLFGSPAAHRQRLAERYNARSY